MSGGFWYGILIGTNFIIHLFVMEPTSFVPKLPIKADSVSQGLMAVARILLVLAIGLTPIFFIPGAPSLLGAAKVYLVLFFVLVMLITFSLSVLRSGSFTLRLSPLLIAWWGVVLAAFVSAVLSPALLSSLFGDALETNTVGFLAILGVLMTGALTFTNAKKSIVYLYGVLLISTSVIVVLHIVRLLFGADTFTLGFLSGAAATPVGSFNDLGLFLTLTILVALIAVVQLSLPRIGMVFAGVLTAGSLIMLMLVNFFAVWLILALFSLALLMYSLTKDRFGVSPGSIQPPDVKVSLGATGLIALVFVVSTVFLIGGSTLGASLSAKTGISFLEIRPSVGATLDIMRSVYAENAFTGTGPNLFTDAWQLHKDRSISETIFWNTPFNAGSGYVLTWFVMTGLFGVIAWFIFLGLFLYTGIMMLVRGQSTDQFWYFTGTTAFVSGGFIWIMSIIYVPGPTILILGAASTGVMIVAYQALAPKRLLAYNMLTTARTGFMLILAVMFIIIGTIAVGYGGVRQFMAAHTFVTAATDLPQEGTNQVSIVIDRLVNAYSLYPSDTYAREIALYHTLNLNRLLAITDATPAQQQEFQQTITAAIAAGTEAVQRKSSDARNWKALADTYAILASINIEGAQARAGDTYKEAEVRDPKNPYYVLQKSIMAYQAKDLVESRRLALLALELKSNYTDGLFILSQIDITAGDVKKAIASTESLIALESNNPGRYFQLGILQAADKNASAAIAAFTAAIALDQNYANARYFRALQYLQTGDKTLALSELAIVRDLSADNKVVDELIGKIERGEVNAASLAENQPVTDPTGVTQDDDVTTSTESPDTNLLKPVNTTKPAQGEESTEETPETAAVGTSTAPTN